MQHFANGDVLTADFVDGMANGKGRIEYANGDCFEGRFVNDLKNGWGKHTFSEKEVSTTFSIIVTRSSRGYTRMVNQKAEIRG